MPDCSCDSSRCKKKKRKLNKLVGGTITPGACPPPIAIYQGPTARRKTKGSATCCAAEPRDFGSPACPKPISLGQEGDSLGNVCRGDWIRTSDLLNPIQAR